VGRGRGGGQGKAPNYVRFNSSPPNPLVSLGPPHERHRARIKICGSINFVFRAMRLAVGPPFPLVLSAELHSRRGRSRPARLDRIEAASIFPRLEALHSSSFLPPLPFFSSCFSRGCYRHWWIHWRSVTSDGRILCQLRKTWRVNVSGNIRIGKNSGPTAFTQIVDVRSLLLLATSKDCRLLREELCRRVTLMRGIRNTRTCIRNKSRRFIYPIIDQRPWCSIWWTLELSRQRRGA